jgi:group I intron endonuclease
MIIYKIQNKINNKIYIGQTKGNLTRRIYAHCRSGFLLHKAIEKYGIQSFDVSVIDYAEDKEILNDKELFWICFYDCMQPKGYNIVEGGGGTSGYRWSEETLQKHRQSAIGRKQSEETKAKRRKSLTGRKRPEEIKQKLKGRKLSEDHKAKVSNSLLGHAISNETKEKISKALIGRHHSEESKEKMRKPKSEQGRKNIAEARNNPLEKEKRKIRRENNARR